MEDKQEKINKLNSLKAQIMGSSVSFEPSVFEANTSELSNSFEDIEPPVNYNEKKNEFNKIAEEEITSIIEIYVKEQKLLNSARIRSKKNNYIRKYTMLLLIIDMYEMNLISIQEGIDTGDRSKDMYDLINKTGAEISKRTLEIDKLLNDCEDFFENYSERFGIESEEEKIVSETTSLDDSEDDVTITTMANIVDMINTQIEEIEKNKKES